MPQPTKKRRAAASPERERPVIGPRDASRLMLLAMARAGVKPPREENASFESPFARQVASALLGKRASAAAKRAAESLVEGYKQRFLTAS